MAAYRTWRAAAGIRFAELPALMGSVLRPGPAEIVDSVTKATFVGARGPPAQPILPPTDNMQTGGSMQFATVHSDEFKTPPPDARRGSPAQQQQPRQQLRRLPLQAETQTMADYKGHDTVKHRRPDMAQPPADKADLKYNKLRSWSTEQRQQFPGVNVSQHPQAASFKPSNTDFKVPTVAMATETTSGFEFTQKPLAEAFRQRVKPPEPRKLFAGAFADTTTSGEAFKTSTSSQPRVRHGDFHLAMQSGLRPVAPFLGQSETKEIFVEKPIVPTLPAKPASADLTPEGERNFQTSHREEFRPPKFRLTRRQAEALKAELRRAVSANAIDACC